jgi:hypothetical protein
LIGHTEAKCKLRDTKTDAESTNQNVFGPWLRSNQFGRRFIDYKDRKYSSNPTKSKNFGHYMPPIPPKLLEELAKMSMENPNQDHHNPQSSSTPFPHH